MLDGHFGLSHVGLLRGRNHLQAAVIGIFLGSLGRGLRCQLPLLIVAVGFNNLLIAANGVFIAKGKYLAEGLDRLLVLVGFAVHRAEPLQKNRPVVLVGHAIFAVGVFGFLQQLIKNLDGVFVFSLGLVNDRNVVLHFQGIRYDRGGFLQRFQCLIEFPVTAIDLGNAHVGLRVRGIGIGNDFVLLQSGVGLAIVHQVLGQAANRIQIIVVELSGAAIGVNRLLIVFLLLVGEPQGGVQLGGARTLWNGAQHLERAGGVAFFVVKISQRGYGFFRIGLYVYCRLEFAFRLQKLVVEPIQAAQQQVVFYALGIELHNLLILLDRQLQNFLRLRPGLHIAEGTQIDAAQQTARLQIVAIALQDVLGFEHGIANAASLGVQFGESGIQVVGSGIVVDRQPILFNRLIGVVSASVHGNQFLVHVRHGEVVIRRRLVRRLRGSRFGWRRGACLVLACRRERLSLRGRSGTWLCLTWRRRGLLRGHWGQYNVGILGDTAHRAGEQKGRETNKNTIQGHSTTSHSTAIGCRGSHRHLLIF